MQNFYPPIFALILVCGSSLNIRDSSSQSQSADSFQTIHDSSSRHPANENLHGLSNVQLGNNETAIGIDELESNAKKAIDSDIKYYEGLMRLTKGSKSQLPVEKIGSLVQETVEHREHLQKKGLTSLSKLAAGSKKAALGLLETSDSRLQNSQQLKAEQRIGDYFSNFTRCIQQMPLLWRASYESASFCRLYAYTCNNLWPENLNSDVTEGMFCIVNTYEQSTDPEEVHATQLMYQNLLTTQITPVFDFLMTYYQYQKPAGTSALESNKLYSCTHAVSDKKKLKCIVQNMKLILKEMGETRPILSTLTSQQSQQLLRKAEGIARGLNLLKQSESIWASLTERASISVNSSLGREEDPYEQVDEAIDDAAKFEPRAFIESILFPTGAGVAGPLVNSLGHREYKFSAALGFVGPLSPDKRFPWDHVQPGLTMTKYKLVQDDPQSVCNDGSSAVIYLNEKSHTKWHFHIDGGFFCYDRESCLMRSKLSPAQSSTIGWEEMKSGSGMFDPHMGGFPEYTHGHAGYCSSDAWMGQSEMGSFEMVGGTVLPDGGSGTYFHGFYVQQSILKLYIKKGLGSTPGQELFVSGCSAGSIAATAAADSWPSRLLAIADEMAVKPFYLPHIWSLLDGAPIVSPPGAAPGHLTIFEYAMKLVNQLYGPDKGTDPSAILNKHCVAAHSENPGECAWTTTVLPYIKSPNLVLVQLWDNFVTGDQFFFFAPGNHMQYEEGLTLVRMTREVMSKVTKSQNYFAIGCGDHCISDNPYFWRQVPPTAPGGYAKLSAKDLTLDTRNGKTGQLVTDTCDNYNCGCFAQGPGLTKLGLAALYFEMFENLTMIPGNFPSGTALAIAADQTYNLGQVLLSP